MANTFLAARGVDVGKSLYEKDLLGEAESIFGQAEVAGCTIHLPYDVVVAREFAPNPASVRTANVHEIAADEMILDIGPAAVEALADVLKTCRTLVWNGPLGAFETPPSTRRRWRWRGPPPPSPGTAAWSRSQAAAIRWAALNQVSDSDFTFVSTAGGAFLEWMEGRTLPGVAALEQA